MWPGVWRRAWLALLSGKFPGVQGAWEELTLQVPSLRRPPRPPSHLTAHICPGPREEKGRRPGGQEGRCAGFPAPAEGRPRLGRAHRVAGVRRGPGGPGPASVRSRRRLFPAPRALPGAGTRRCGGRRRAARSGRSAGPAAAAAAGERPGDLGAGLAAPSGRPSRGGGECLARVPRRALGRPAPRLLPSLRPSSARGSVPGARCRPRKTPAGSRPGGSLLPESARPCPAPPRSGALASGLSGPARLRPPAPRGRARIAAPAEASLGRCGPFFVFFAWSRASASKAQSVRPPESPRCLSRGRDGHEGGREGRRRRAPRLPARPPPPHPARPAASGAHVGRGRVLAGDRVLGPRRRSPG